MKRFLVFYIGLSAFFFLLFFSSASAADKTITLYYGRECPHCQKEEKFLDQLEKDYPEVKVERLEVWHDQDNQEKFKEISLKFNNPNFSVPLTIIADQSILGFDSAETTGQEIRQLAGITEDKDNKEEKEK